jgi:phage terminase small subunit
MTDDPEPLPPRHARFVAEFLKDGNATQAYIRAGYSPRGAQPSASRLLRQPAIEAAIAAGRQCIAQALEVTAERLAQEYARIAFANVADYVSVDGGGRLRIDLEKASQAQQAGILELRVGPHSKQEQTVILKLGKLQALAALTKQMGGLAISPKVDRTEEILRERRLRYEAEDRAKQLALELAEARAAVQAPVDAADPAAPPLQDESGAPPFNAPPRDAEEPPIAPREPDPPCPQMPGMPTSPLPDFDPGPLNGKLKWVMYRQPDPDHDPYMMTCQYDPYACLSEDDDR